MDIAVAIARCKNLRVLHVEYNSDHDAEIFSIIARGCPLLKKFYLHDRGMDGWYHDPEWTGNQFSQFLQELPRLQILSTAFKIQLDASNLLILAHACPRLRFLELKNGILFIDQPSLAEVPTLRHLQILRVRDIVAANPRCFGHQVEVEVLQGNGCESSHYYVKDLVYEISNTLTMPPLRLL